MTVPSIDNRAGIEVRNNGNYICHDSHVPAIVYSGKFHTIPCHAMSGDERRRCSYFGLYSGTGYHYIYTRPVYPQKSILLNMNADELKMFTILNNDQLDKNSGG
jgi:hypothetical protein